MRRVWRRKVTWIYQRQRRGWCRLRCALRPHVCCFPETQARCPTTCPELSLVSRNQQTEEARSWLTCFVVLSQCHFHVKCPAGNGLVSAHSPPRAAKATKAGILRFQAPNTYRIDNQQRRVRQILSGNLKISLITQTDVSSFMLQVCAKKG